MKEAQDKADLELAKRDPWWAQHLADKKAMERALQQGILFVQAEEEEEEEEADASYLLSSWPRSSSASTAACSCVSLRHVVDVPVVRYVQLPQVQRRDLRRQFLLSLVQVEGQGSLRAVGGVSVRRQDHQGGPCYFGSVAQMCASAWHLWVSASVLHPTWQRITPSMSYACLLSVAWE